MSRFALKYPYLIIVCCLVVCVLGVNSLVRMPVDLFPAISITVVVVATFYSGMPAEQTENDITGPFERFFTLGSGIDHLESTSLPGVSLIKIYFQPGFDADAAVTEIANLAMADLRRLPPGTLPPVVLKFDASSLPVCLITLKAPGLTEATLRDLGQYNVRNQVANIPGASVPQPFGGKYRQIMVYVDPLKLEAYGLGVMDIVHTVNKSNLILPSGDTKIGRFDYNLFTNSQIDVIADMNHVPLKSVGQNNVTIADVGRAMDAAAIQTNIVLVDGQPSVYLPIMKQGGDSNTISIVNGVKRAVAHLTDVPKNLIAKVIFDQSVFVKNAIHNLTDEGLIGLALTGLMILLFLGSLRATAGTFLSIPLSAMATFIVLSLKGDTVNVMILGGLALIFSRLIDNSVVVLENIYRHLENGESPAMAAATGGGEMNLPVLAATLSDISLAYFSVTFLYGVSKYLFTALALAMLLALFGSYFVAMTVMPLFCEKFLRRPVHHAEGAGAAAAGPAGRESLFARFNRGFNRRFEGFLGRYDRWVRRLLARPWLSLVLLSALCLVFLAAAPWVGVAYFPRTDPGQFVVNVKAATGTRVEETAAQVARVEATIRRIVAPGDLDVIASNIGVTPDFSAIYTSNTGTHMAFVQVNLKEGHRIGSYEYMNRVRQALAEDQPQLTIYFQTGGLVDAVVNMGLPAPIDIQVAGDDLEQTDKLALSLARRIRTMPGVGDVFIPQDVDAPSLTININRTHASELGLSQKQVVDAIITALTSNQMIAPSYWVDPRNGNDYMLTVQYPEGVVKSLEDLKAIPVRAPGRRDTVRLDAVADIRRTLAPTVVNHYQLKRIIDIYVAPKGEALGGVLSRVNALLAGTPTPENMNITLRGAVQAMHTSFLRFGAGLLMSVALIYLILVAQFRSFVDPFIILLAVPPGIAGAVDILAATGTTLNVMSLMGANLLVGIAVSNSILIVEFAHRLREAGHSASEAVALACRVRLRPILMTSLATVIGLIPMALALGAGSETYASLARVVIGGLTVSVAMTVFIVPVAYLLIYRRAPSGKPAPLPLTAEPQT